MDLERCELFHTSPQEGKQGSHLLDVDIEGREGEGERWTAESWSPKKQRWIQYVPHTALTSWVMLLHQ